MHIKFVSYNFSFPDVISHHLLLQLECISDKIWWQARRCDWSKTDQRRQGANSVALHLPSCILSTHNLSAMFSCGCVHQGRNNMSSSSSKHPWASFSTLSAYIIIIWQLLNYGMSMCWAAVGGRSRFFASLQGSHAIDRRQQPLVQDAAYVRQGLHCSASKKKSNKTHALTPLLKKSYFFIATLLPLYTVIFSLYWASFSHLKEKCVEQGAIGAWWLSGDEQKESSKRALRPSEYASLCSEGVCWQWIKLSLPNDCCSCQ